MLHFLRQNGPSTKGIFQNIDNVDSFLCLKERIMFGQTLNWENESPLVVAAALKVGRVLLSSVHSMKSV